MTGFAWRSDASSDGVRRREFVAEHEGGEQVPGVLWSPEHSEVPPPLVILGHGGGHHKTHAVTEIWRARIMAQAPVAVASIDFPGHGERGEIRSAADPAFLDLIGDPAQYDQASADLSLSLSTLRATGEVDGSAVAYFGLSLAGWFGFPFVADDHRLRAAVLGLIGTGYPALEAAGREAPERGAWQRATKITVPTAFILPWDELARARSVLRCGHYGRRVTVSGGRAGAAGGHRGLTPRPSRLRRDEAWRS